MSQIDKEAEQNKAIEVKCKSSSEKLNIVRIDDEESSPLPQCPCIALNLMKNAQKSHLEELLL
jgi:hypothetical protein